MIRPIMYMEMQLLHTICIIYYKERVSNRKGCISIYKLRVRVKRGVALTLQIYPKKLSQNYLLVLGLDEYGKIIQNVIQF